MRASFSLFVAFLAVSPLACDGCHKTAPPTAPDAQVKVTLEAGEVRIDGVACAKRAELPPAPARVAPVFGELESRREAWRKTHTRLEFPGTAELVVPADATCVEVMSLVATLAASAYSHVTVTQATNTLQVDYWFPGPGGPFDLPDPDPPLPLQLRFRPGGKVAVSRTCTGTPDVIAVSEVPARVDATRPFAEGYRVGCDEGVLFADVLPTLSAIRKLRPMKLADDGCASARDGGAPLQVLAPTLGLSGLGPPAKLVHRPGTLGETKVSVSGIDEALARAAVAPHLGAIAKCFEDKRTARDVGTIGTAGAEHRTVELVVASDGGIALAAGGGASNDLDLCLARELVGLVFPPRDGGSVKLVYDFSFVDAP